MAFVANVDLATADLDTTEFSAMAVGGGMTIAIGPTSTRTAITDLSHRSFFKGRSSGPFCCNDPKA